MKQNVNDKKKDFFSRLDSNVGKFTKSDRKIADFIVRSYPKSLLLNSSEISKQLNVNSSTVTRFFSKLGYRNAKDIQDDFKKELFFLMNSPVDRYHEQQNNLRVDNSSCENILSLDIENIKNTLRNINQKDVLFAAELLNDKNHNVFIVGERKQFALAYYLYNHINAIRQNVFFITSTNAPDYLSSCCKDDIVILFDFRRYPTLNYRIAKFVKNIVCYVFAIVDSPIAPISKLSNATFLVYTKSHSPFDSYTAAVSLINFIVAETIRKSGDGFENRYKHILKTYNHLDTFQY